MCCLKKTWRLFFCVTIPGDFDQGFYPDEVIASVDGEGVDPWKDFLASHWLDWLAILVSMTEAGEILGSLAFGLGNADLTLFFEYLKI